MAFSPQTFSFEQVLTSAQMTQVDANIDAVRSFHKGSSAPASPVAGAHWIDDTTEPWLDQVFDGTDWIKKGEIDPTANIYIGQPWELIGTATASASAFVDFTWGSTVYKLIVLIMTGALPASNNQDLWIRTSTDDGGAFDAGPSDYAWLTRLSEMDTTPTVEEKGDDADNQIAIQGADGIGNTANEGIDGIIEIFSPAETVFTSLVFRGNLRDQASKEVYYSGSGIRLSAADVNGVRVLFQSGNIASGEFACYGLR